MCTKRTLCIMSLWISLSHMVNGQSMYTENSNSHAEKLATQILKTEIQHMAQNIETSVLLKLQEIVEGKINEMMKKQSAEKDISKRGTDCADILKKFPETRNKNGVYNITGPKNDKKAVYCEMTTDNGGWMVIQQRINGLTEFYRNWSEYRNGFGNPIEDHWLGLEMMHTLTTKKAYELRVDVQRFNGDRAYAKYTTFSVESEATKYKLNVNGYRGTAGDSMKYSNGMKFSTKDQDNDDDSGQCATHWKSAWWFKSCFYTNPNGQYTDSEKNGWKYVVWYYWKKKNLSLKSIKMMIRPKN